jgi:hypothetical protein
MKRTSHLTTISLLLGTALLLLAAGCGGGEAVSLGPVGNTTRTTTPGHHRGPLVIPLQVWLARSDGLVAVKRESRATSAVATAAIKALLAGPTPKERAAHISTAIPRETRLLGIALHNGVATIDLTAEFGTGGGALSVQDRLGQIVYTLTEFPTIKKVLFRLDGAPVHVFSSEGIVLDHPVTRQDYVNLLPPITVIRPAPDAHVSSPVLVSGDANVFEANVSIEVLDENGKVVGKTFTTASCGTGCRGTFSVRVPFHVTTEQQGTIVVHDDDAAGTGTPPHSVRIPVTLAP